MHRGRVGTPTCGKSVRYGLAVLWAEQRPGCVCSDIVRRTNLRGEVFDEKALARLVQATSACCPARARPPAGALHVHAYRPARLYLEAGGLGLCGSVRSDAFLGPPPLRFADARLAQLGGDAKRQTGALQHEQQLRRLNRPRRSSARAQERPYPQINEKSHKLD